MIKQQYNTCMKQAKNVQTHLHSCNCNKKKIYIKKIYTIFKMFFNNTFLHVIIIEWCTMDYCYIPHKNWMFLPTCYDSVHALIKYNG